MGVFYIANICWHGRTIKQGYKWHGSDMKKEVPMADKDFQIRNSTIDFLVFTKQNSTDSIQVRVHELM